MMNSFRHRILPYVVLLVLGPVINSCAHLPPAPPPTSPCTFNLSNIFAHCHNPTSSTNVISYSVHFEISYYKSSQPGTLDEKDVSSAATPSGTLSIISKLPTDGTPYTVSVTITGKQCARCALTQDANGYCIQNSTTTGSGFAAHTAAVPVEFYQLETTGYHMTYSISSWEPTSNVAGSCGCVVQD